MQSWLIGSAQGNLWGQFLLDRPISMAIVALAILTLFYPLIAARLGVVRAPSPATGDG